LPFSKALESALKRLPEGVDSKGVAAGVSLSVELERFSSYPNSLDVSGAIGTFPQ
jgi:hypothetical protein